MTVDDLMKHYGEHRDIFYDRLEEFLLIFHNSTLSETANHFRGLAVGSHEMTIDDVTDEIVSLIKSEL